MGDAASEAREEQRRLYGIGVGEAVGDVAATLDLSQAAIARVLGVSAPMLSQVVNGHRVKFGNPLAVQRLRSLLDLAAAARAGLGFDEVRGRLDAIAAEASTTLTDPSLPRRSGSASSTEGAEVISAALRALASGRQLSAAADLVAADAPDLAEFLRVYGTGSPGEARAHFAGIAHLL